jgi:hypothetical protein
LFQGNFFRHIMALRHLVPKRECIAEVEIPLERSYFEPDDCPPFFTPHPAARDAFLQAIQLMLAEDRGLPVRIEKLGFLRRPESGARVLCRASRRSRERNVYDVDVFDLNGAPLEYLHGVSIHTMPAPASVEHPHLEEVAKLLAERRPKFDHALVIELNATPHDVRRVRGAVRLGNRLAAQQAGQAFAMSHFGAHINPDGVQLSHDPDGRPRLLIHGLTSDAEEIGVSISDTGFYSAALVAAGPVGLDLEQIEPKNVKTWHTLLGNSGLELALKIVGQTHEDLHTAATLVWTLMEAAKKSQSRTPPPLSMDFDNESPWFTFTLHSPVERRFDSVLARDGKGNRYVLTVTLTAASEENAIPHPKPGFASSEPPQRS